YVAAKLDNDDTPDDPIANNDRDHNSTGTDVRHTNDRNAKERTVNEGDSNRRGPDNHTSNRRDTEEEAVTDEVKNEIAEIVQDRKSTRLNSSHVSISYAVFCLKKKK